MRIPRATAFAVIFAAALFPACEYRITPNESKKESAHKPRPSGEKPARKLNVVLISIDTLRPDHVHCLGYERETTPNLDTFARDAVRFPVAIAQSSWSLPSHASLFTSLYVPRHGTYGYYEQLPGAATTVAEIFKIYGYDTVAFTGDFHVGSEYGLSQGFDIYDDKTPFATFGHTVPAAKKWVRSNRGRPFFLFLHGYDAHAPYRVPSPEDHYFDADYSGLIDNVTLDHSLGALLSGGGGVSSHGAGDHPSGSRSRGKGGGRAYPFTGYYTERDHQHLIAHYDAAVRWADRSIGEFLAFLKEEGLWDDTLVAVVSDHGETLGEHGNILVRKHGGLYEEGIRVVAMFRIPGRPRRAEKISVPVSLIDVAPTLLDAVGIAPPREFQGSSLLPWYVGQKTEDDEVRRYQFTSVSHDKNGIRSARWKLIDRPVQRQLFDLSVDPGETRNLIDEKPHVARELLDALDLWKEENTNLFARVSQSGIPQPKGTARRMREAGYWWLDRAGVVERSQATLRRGVFATSREGCFIGARDTVFRWDGRFWGSDFIIPGEVFRRIRLTHSADGAAKRASPAVFRLLGKRGIYVRKGGTWVLEEHAWLPKKLRDFFSFKDSRFAFASRDALFWADRERITSRRDFPGAGFHTLEFSGAGRGVALGENGVFALWDGRAWKLLKAPGRSRLNSARFQPDGGVLLVGDRGTMFTFRDGRFFRHPRLVLEPLKDVVLLPDGTGWIVGGYGTVLQWDGVSAKRTKRVTAADLFSLARDPSGRTWIFGENGEILVRDADRWNSKKVELWLGGRVIVAGARLPSGSVCALELNGTFLRLTQGTWKEWKEAPNRTFTRIAVSTSGRGVAAGRFQALAVYRPEVRDRSSGDETTGGQWMPVPVPSRQQPKKSARPGLLGVAFDPDGHAWAVGEEGTVLRETAEGRFVSVTTPADQNLHAVDFASDGTGWVVGERGTILRWDGGRLTLVPRPSPKKEAGKEADGGGSGNGEPRTPSFRWVAAVGKDRAYAGGVGGVYEWRENAWTPVLGVSSTGPYNRAYFRSAKEGYLSNPEGEVFRFDGKTLSPLPKLPKPKRIGRWRPRVAQLLAGPNGELEVLTRNGGLYFRWNGSRWISLYP